MQIIQCTYNNVRSSESGKTQSFTFRLFAHVLLMDENKIYAPHSPVLRSDSTSDVANSAAKYAFYTVLRGIDYPKQESDIEKEKSKAELKGKIGQLYDLCNEMRVNIEKNRLAIDGLQLNQIQIEINRLKTLVSAQKEALVEKQDAFDKKTRLIAELEERQFRIQQTIDKLLLLKVNYQSDIDRLDFIVITNETEERITHNIFYTAITRAKEKLKIYWSPETENAILERLKVKNSNSDAYLLAQLSSLTMA